MTDELSAILSAYRTDAGVRAALLVNTDGFLVAADADGDLDTTAVAAHVADALRVCHHLALELGQHEARFITFELSALNVIVAPFDGDVLLILVGEPGAVNISYSLRTDHGGQSEAAR